MLRFSAFLLPAALLLLPSAAAQAPPQVSEKLVTFTIINSDLLTTLVRLERQYHIQCVLQDSVNAHRKIDMAVSGMPLSQTLHFLASSADAEVTQNPDGVYLFTPKFTRISNDPSHSLPGTHFINGSRSFGFGYVSPLQQFPVVFPYTPPVTLSDMLNGQDLERMQPGGVRRVFALGQSF